jgi:hypothetical protein
MTILEWNEATEWNNAQSESGVVHENTASTDHTDATVVKKGYSAASPYLSNTLLGYWPMHDSSGPLTDFSGNNKDLSASGGPTFDYSALLGTTGVDFDNSDDYFEVSDDGTLNPGTGAYWAFWAYPVDTGDFDTPIHKYDYSNNDGYRILFDNRSSRKQITFDSLNNGTTDQLTADLTNHYGSWTHVVCTIDGNAQELYVNGSVVDSQTPANGGPSAASVPFVLGARLKSGSYDLWTQAPMWDVRVGDRKLTSSEVQTLYDVVDTAGTLTTGKKTS